VTTSDPPDEAGPAEPAPQLADLDHELHTLREALHSRTLTGQATGLLAARLNLSTDQAWHVLRVTSNVTNLKLRDVARIVVAGQDRALTPRDAPIAARINEALPTAVFRAQHHHGDDAGEAD
jgi:response regulator NasT